VLLLIPDDLSNEQISKFQWKIDKSAQGWFKINKGDEGMTNYIHDLHAGHISDYLLHSQLVHALATRMGGVELCHQTVLVPLYQPGWWTRFRQLPRTVGPVGTAAFRLDDGL
jgi:hypothetical protein